LVVAAAFLAVASAASLSLEDMEFYAWKLKFGKRVSFFSCIKLGKRFIMFSSLLNEKN